MFSCEALMDVDVPSKVLLLPDLANKNTKHPNIAGSIRTLNDHLLLVHDSNLTGHLIFYLANEAAIQMT